MRYSLNEYMLLIVIYFMPANIGVSDAYYSLILLDLYELAYRIFTLLNYAREETKRVLLPSVLFLFVVSTNSLWACERSCGDKCTRFYGRDPACYSVCELEK